MTSGRMCDTRNLVGGVLRVFCSPTQGATPTHVLSYLGGPIHIAEDTYYAKENSVVYVGRKSVTVIGATWAPEIGERLSDEIRT